MNRGSRTLLIIILVIAAILGIGAVGLLWYNSTLGDDDGDGGNVGSTANKCNLIFVLDATENELDQDTSLDPSQAIFIGAEFQVDRDVLPDIEIGENVELADFGFAFTVNSAKDHKVITVVDVQESGDYYIFTPKYSFSDFGSNSTLSIVADFDADDNVELSNALGANSSCASVYEVQREGNQGGTCVAIGDSGTIGSDQCCAGLEQVDSCTEPDSANQCTLEVPDCFTCVNVIGDNDCGTGENICNSPLDCEGPTTEPDSDICIAAGGTGDGGKGEVCCANLNEVNCETPNSSNSCSDEDASCFRCIAGEPDDGLCESGENICNSYNDCQDEIIDPGTPPGTPSDGGSGEQEEDFDPPAPTNENSNFTVTVTSSQQCVERISPNNTTNITITIRNGVATAHTVSEVTNSLPLGFTFVRGSALINGVADTSDQYITINQIGDSQELVWTTSNGWSVAANGTMTIQFRVIAAQNALTGNALNEVVVTPANIPVSSTSLRASVTVNISQNCSTPQTAILGNSSTKIIAGTVALMIALLFYITSAGELVSMKLAGNKVVGGQAEKVRMIHLKRSNPREYFEEKFRKSDKKK